MTTWSNDETGGSIFSSDEPTASTVLAQLAASTGSSLVGFKQSGTGGIASTVAAALWLTVHTSQFLTAGNFTTALNALTGTQGLAPTVKIGYTSGNPLTVGRSAVTFNTTVDNFSSFGYNVATNGASIPDAADSSLGVFLESDYNDGSVRYIEYHVDLAIPGGSYERPFFAAMARTGANAGKITEVFLLSEVLISFYGPLVRQQAAAAYTLGAEFDLVSLDTGGKTWSLYSTGSGAGLGAGHLFIFNGTNTRYGLICDKNGSVIAGNLAAIATNATDGFLYVPSCAGTPTGTPTTYTGTVPIVVNTTNNKLYFYSGGAWRDAGP